jgi:hypothetical protein
MVPRQGFLISPTLSMSRFTLRSSTEGDSAIWAVNQWLLRRQVLGKLGIAFAHGHELRDVLMRRLKDAANNYVGYHSIPASTPNLVVPVEPSLLTERMSRQQGFFLMPTNLERSFVDGLCSALDLEACPPDPPILSGDERSHLLEAFYPDPEYAILKIEISREVHDETLKHLTAMNVHAETLFPGLDGYARSLLQTVIRHV